MSEQQAALAHTATAPAAVAARPRISADAFRNLTARLKKSDVSIPDLSPIAVHVQHPPVMPAIAVTPAPVLETLQASEPVSVEAPESQSLAPIEIEPEILTAEPLEAISVAPVIDAPPEMPPVQAIEMASLSPVLIEPVSFEPVSFEEPAVQHVESAVEHAEPISILHPSEVIETAHFDIETVGFVEPVVHESADDAPSSGMIEPQLIDPVFDHTSTEPEAFVEASVDVAQEDVQLQAMLADLPPFVENPVVAAPTAVAKAPDEPVLSGGFSENFTYVPEAGKNEPSVQSRGPETESSLAEIDEAVRQELAQRATELELENIWRMLLAKPTVDDRATYMREAAEYHAADEEWNKPSPEHDLSSIQPAEVIETVEPDLSQFASEEVAQTEIATRLPQVAGQDVAELARSLLDMMAAGNASGLPQERALAADTLLRLVPRLDLKPVILLAQRLAMMDSPPHLLVTRLIRDPRPEVAGPLLEDCMHIPDKDLESLVLEGDPEKLRLIARRRRLSRAISDALITSGDPSVVLTLIRNAEAEISHDGFKSLLVLCENNADLLAPLATRQDLSAPFAFELFWLAPAQLRRFILSRFLTDSETLTKILKITMATNLEDDAEGEAISQHALLEALERAARGHIDVASEELAGLLQVAPATVARILGDIEGEALVVMLKAAGYPRSAMAGLLKRMQDADLPVISRNRDATELQTMFETLSFNKARILLTYWDWAVVKLGPYAPVH